MKEALLGRFDYIIVGAGSAGCVLANRLSADPNVKVCLIEAGGADWYPWIHIPVGYFHTFDNPRTDWRFRTEPEPGLSGRSIKYPRGRVLGGSSSINGMVYIRGHAADYDGWRAQGNVGWAWNDVLPYFKKSEDQARGASEAHGVGGELRIEDLRASWDVLDSFCAAAVECGIPPTADFNAGENEGAGYFQVTQKGGFRMSTARAFLKPARRRLNLTVLSNSQAKRIRFDGRRATGIELQHGGKDAFVRAEREVVLACGTVGSPQLLQLSGIGDGAALQELGIGSIRHLPGVGENLQDHLAMRTMYRVHNTTTLNQQASSLWGRFQMGWEYLLHRRGPLTIPPALVTAFFKSDASRATPDLQLVCYPLTYDAVGDPPHKFAGFSASVCLLHPESRGQIKLKSANPFDAPAIRLNFLTEPADRAKAITGLRKVRQVCASAAMSRYAPEEFAPGANLQSDEEIIQGISKLAGTIFHPVGTCKMGNDPLAVVDSRLRVHGVDGLRVVDASIMPTIISGNTNATTIMIAEKAADMIREDLISSKMAAEKSEQAPFRGLDVPMI
ncbi:GMC family oxidoreductase [Burkholderia ubonensis]|uniref:GMC family oxidoreductase n=1 Tax=Burkholderia ubonensis TaxID=101571 RepID=UPI002ABD7E0E|nr:GMC family oxidoreductase N-terminal domain-containing protein [Burkholderia ubonensis]